MATEKDFGLGRRKKLDERDEKYLIKSLLPKRAAKKTYQYWSTTGYWGDQGDSPHCVGYSWVHWLEDGPTTQFGKAPIVDPSGVYRLAQRVDEWPGEAYDGTSVRAGAKVLHTLGFIESYNWAWDINTLIDALLNVGPVVVGTNWYNGMFFPNSKGILEIKGRLAGGHAYKLDGINMTEETIRLKNSWSRSWGTKGFAKIRFDDMERLINEDGEVCLAVEIKKPKG